MVSFLPDTEISEIKGASKRQLEEPQFRDLNISGKVISIVEAPIGFHGLETRVYRIMVEDHTGRIIVNYYFGQRFDFNFKEGDLIRVEGAVARIEKDGIELGLVANKRGEDIYKKSQLLKIIDIRPDMGCVSVFARVSSIVKGGGMYEGSGGRLVDELKVVLEDETGKIELLTLEPSYVLGALANDFSVGDKILVENVYPRGEKDKSWHNFYSFKPKGFALDWGYRSRVTNKGNRRVEEQW